MKTYINKIDDNHLELQIEVGGSKAVVASINGFAEDAWIPKDLRLHEFEQPSQYSGSLRADDMLAHWQPESPEEADYVRSLLREYEEAPDGSITWCSFQGLVRGTPREGVFLSRQNQLGYHTKTEVMAWLEDVRAWWEGYTGEASKAKIDNPDKQMTSSQMMMYCVGKRMGLDVPPPPEPVRPTKRAT